MKNASPVQGLLHPTAGSWIIRNVLRGVPSFPGKFLLQVLSNPWMLLDSFAPLSAARGDGAGDAVLMDKWVQDWWLHSHAGHTFLLETSFHPLSIPVSHSHLSRGFLVMDFSSQSWRKLRQRFYRQQRDSPLLAGSLSVTRTNRNSPFIQRWPSVTLQWGSQVLFSGSPDQNSLVPRKWKIKLGTCGNGGEISPLLPLWKLFRLSSVPLGGWEKRIIVTSSCRGHNPVINKQLQVLEPYPLRGGFDVREARALNSQLWGGNSHLDGTRQVAFPCNKKP